MSAVLCLADLLPCDDSARFSRRLRARLESLGVDELPLQAGLSHSSVALDSDLRAVILALREEGAQLRVRAGLFYTGLVAGCGCADDPSPNTEQNEYCEILLDICTATGAATIRLAPS